MRTFEFAVERDPDTGHLVGYVPVWPGAHTQGADKRSDSGWCGPPSERLQPERVVECVERSGRLAPVGHSLAGFMLHIVRDARAAHLELVPIWLGNAVPAVPRGELVQVAVVPPIAAWMMWCGLCSVTVPGTSSRRQMDGLVPRRVTFSR